MKNRIKKLMLWATVLAVLLTGMSAALADTQSRYVCFAGAAQAYGSACCDGRARRSGACYGSACYQGARDQSA